MITKIEVLRRFPIGGRCYIFEVKIINVRAGGFLWLKRVETSRIVLMIGRSNNWVDLHTREPASPDVATACNNQFLVEEFSK